MRKLNFGFAAILLLSAAAFVQAQSVAVQRYQLPPKEVVAAFDAQPLPSALLSPSKQMFALTYRHPYPTIAELSQPILRLAGARVNPRNNGPQRAQEVLSKMHDVDALFVLKGGRVLRTERFPIDA